MPRRCLPWRGLFLLGFAFSLRRLMVRAGISGGPGRRGRRAGPVQARGVVGFPVQACLVGRWVFLAVTPDCRRDRNGGGKEIAGKDGVGWRLFRMGLGFAGHSPEREEGLGGSSAGRLYAGGV